MGTNQENLISSSVEDSILFKPIPLWSNEAVIQVVVDDDASDTSSFILDIRSSKASFLSHGYSE